MLYLEACILTCRTGKIPTESATPLGDTRVHCQPIRLAESAIFVCLYNSQLFRC
jgi:hypothetical protein